MNEDFKAKMRERILGAFTDLMPPAELDALVESEVKAFFHTERLLTVETTKVELKNPQYEPAKGWGYGNEPTVKRECLAFGSQMSPFRQLVWSELHQHLQPKLKEAFNDHTAKVSVELNKWVADIAKPAVGEVNSGMFSQIATGMSAAMLHGVLVNAASTAHLNLTTALSKVGYQNDIPFLQPPPGYVPDLQHLTLKAPEGQHAS